MCYELVKGYGQFKALEIYYQIILQKGYNDKQFHYHFMRIPCHLSKLTMKIYKNNFAYLTDEKLYSYSF